MSTVKRGISIRRSLRRLSLLIAPVLTVLYVLFLDYDAPLIGAQEEVRLSIDQVIVSEDAENITALVSAIDAIGQAVPGLSEFSADIDGVPVPLDSVDSVINQELGIAALLLMDASGSMEGEPLAQGQAAAGAFVRGLLAQDLAALITFAGATPDEADFTMDRERLLAEIGAIQTEGETGTALYDAVVNGLAATDRAPTARRAVVLLTDGQDSGNISESSRGAALELAANAGVPIFAIGLGDAADVAFLQALADVSSGEFYSAPTPADVPGIFDAVGTRLRSAYALSLLLPPSELVERELLVRLDLNGTALTAQTTFPAPGAVVNAPKSDSADVAPWVWAAAALVAVIGGVLGVGGMRLRRRLRHRSALPGGPGSDVSISRSPRESPSEPSTLSGRLSVVAGPNAGLTVSLDAGPIDIGSDSTCGLQLDQAGAAVAGTHARAWLQHDRLMLHHLARTGETLVGGQAIEWAALESDENIEIGPHVITFLLDA